MRQLEHHQVQNYKHDKEIIVVVEDVISPENIGMIFRVAEAMGVREVMLTGETPNPPNRKIAKTARNTEKRLSIRCFSSSEPAISILKQNDFQIGALEITDKSKRISSINFKSMKKIAIIIGSETSGIQKGTLQLISESWNIPMFGQNSSMNVVTALSIALHEMVRIS